MNSKRILAGIVLYNPDIDRLKANIKAVYEQVDSVLLINNASFNMNEVRSLINGYSDIGIINNDSNMGVAHALGQIMDYAMQHGYSWALTLDQDSVCYPGLINAYSQYFELPKVGILTCNIIDRNFMENNGFMEGQQCRDVSQCITSASLVNVDAYRHTDGFDDKLFIDSVDFDICINMRIHGYRIVKINYDGLLHEVGHGRNVKLFMKNYIAYGHSPFRQYYIARNHGYLVKKYPRQFSHVKELIREIRDELLILLYEKDKLSKLKQRWRGLSDSRHM
ncbi:glycosyltransferase family 2 protein [Bifidobacterium imperatoris]|uniref:Glycosyltransferase family 2 protein n=1 Tax=Bifidobacterium imperatoris TaxID=2020965 RepID=A0A2N5IRG5_9BIFI|nr:glycosyltransferase family 2 protein [Bifidobacterium imperatoris]PLS24549.1 glycosyltransferase group 2 family protein [Bifidobacterium imperatoris]QSY58069.1 glycosyltransferase family 2 protein [Bifidobacterium imperatoris]